MMIWPLPQVIAKLMAIQYIYCELEVKTYIQHPFFKWYKYFLSGSLSAL